MITITGNDELKKFISENNLSTPSEYGKEWVENEMKRLDRFIPVCELVPVYHFDKQEGNDGLFTGEMIIKYGEHLLKASGESQKEMVFDLSLFNGIKSPYLEGIDMSEYDLQRPKRVSKITVKKMDSWIKYLLQREEIYETFINSVTEKIQNFRALLQPYSEFIHYGGDNNSGTYARGGLYYRFEIDKSGRIFEVIGLSRVQHDFGTFIQMSDNQYVSGEVEIVNPENEDFLLFATNVVSFYSETSRPLYRTYVSALERFRSGISFKDINSDFFKEFRTYCLDKLARSEKTLERILTFYRKVISLAVDGGYMSDNPLKD